VVEKNGRAAEANRALTVRLAHASPGRVRLRAVRAAPDLTALQVVERRLRENHGGYDADLNPATRSLLIRFDPGTHRVPDILETVAAAGVTIEEPANEAIPELPAGTMALGDAIDTTASRLNRWVASRTSGGADLRTLVPVGFALLALREIVSGRFATVPWYAFAWYAFDSYWKLRGAKPGDDERAD